MRIIKISLICTALSISLLFAISTDKSFNNTLKNIRFSLDVDNEKIEKDLKNNIVDINQEIKNHYNDIDNSINNFDTNKYVQDLTSNNLYSSFLGDIKNNYSNLASKYNRYTDMFKNISNANADDLKDTVDSKITGNFQGIKTSQNLLNICMIYADFQSLGSKYIFMFSPTTKTVSYYLNKTSFLLNKSFKLNFLIIKSTLLTSKTQDIKNKLLLFMLKFYKKKENDEK